MEGTQVIIFDLETNGLDHTQHSVLSVSAIKALWQGDLIVGVDLYDRYYYPTEPLRAEAVNVNGLTCDVIRAYRDGVDYPQHFKDDVSAFKTWCGDAQHFTAHNIEFDRAFLPFDLPNQFCSCLANTDILRLPHKHHTHNKKHDYKFPNLRETARFYNVPFNPEDMHTSQNDALILFRIFRAMFRCPGEPGQRVRGFLEGR